MPRRVQFRGDLGFAAVLLAVIAVHLYAQGASAGTNSECCSECGRHSHVQRVCRLVCETKKVTETHYGVKHEDICLPGRSQKCGCEWIPTCGKVKTVKKLMKLETTKEVPVYKCVVEYVCRDCCHRLASAGEKLEPATTR